MSNPALSPLRWLTPGQLAICVVLFFLPWIEIQCRVPDLGNLGNLGNLANPNNPQQPVKPEIKITSWRPLMTQSGYEAAAGQYTIADPDLRRMMDQGKQAAKQAGAKTDDDKVKKAPLLWAYLLAAVVGVGVGLAVPPGGPRKVILILCCGIALVAAGGQAAAGFPIEQDIKEQKNDQAKAGINPGGEEFIRVRYKVPFYLALVFAVGALVTTTLEPVGTGARKKPLYDFEDEPGGDLGEAEPLPDEPPRH